MRFLRSLVIALKTALKSLQTGVWRWVEKAGDMIWTFVPGSAAGAAAAPEVVEEVLSESEIVQRWAAEKVSGTAGERLPDGLSPSVAGWCTRFRQDDLRQLARATPAQIERHLAGEPVLPTVRSVVVARVEAMVERDTGRPIPKVAPLSEDRLEMIRARVLGTPAGFRLSAAGGLAAH